MENFKILLNDYAKKYNISFSDNEATAIFAKNITRLNKVFMQPDCETTAKEIEKIIKETVNDKINGKSIEISDKECELIDYFNNILK